MSIPGSSQRPKIEPFREKCCIFHHDDRFVPRIPIFAIAFAPKSQYSRTVIGDVNPYSGENRFASVSHKRFLVTRKIKCLSAPTLIYGARWVKKRYFGAVENSRGRIFELLPVAVSRRFALVRCSRISYGGGCLLWVRTDSLDTHSQGIIWRLYVCRLWGAEYDMYLLFFGSDLLFFSSVDLCSFDLVCDGNSILCSLLFILWFFCVNLIFRFWKYDKTMLFL